MDGAATDSGAFGGSGGASARRAHDAGLTLAGGFWRGATRRRAWWLTLLLVLVLLLNIAVQYAINEWQGAFFNAIERREADQFVTFVLSFAGLALLSIVLSVAQLLSRMRLQIEWRRWISRRLMQRWLGERRFYRLGVQAPEIDSPEFRIAEDARVATEPVVDFGHGFASALITGIVFLGVLWRTGGSREIGGATIPGFMVWAALLYALVMTGSMWRIARPVIATMRARNAAEAGLRFDMARVRENAESIALLQGGPGEEAQLAFTLDGVVGAWRAVMRQQARLNVLTATNWVAAGVIPLLLMAPHFMAGTSSLGTLVQCAAAFVQVQGALTWFVDNTPRIGEWLASVCRVAALSEAMVAIDASADGGADGSSSGIALGASPDDRLRLAGFALAHGDGRPMLAPADAAFAPGERIWISGPSGIGKSTLVRAIAGLWRWGGGAVLVPAGAQMMFLPQRPYMPVGSFRSIVCYPPPPRPVDERTLLAVLERCDLLHFADRLDAEERWDKLLSGGEQQRVGFARLLIARPDIVVMDEATSALDVECQDKMMRLFEGELRGATLISVGHRPELAAYHTHEIRLVRTPGGARLEQDRRPALRPVEVRLGAPRRAVGSAAPPRLRIASGPATEP